MIDTSRVSDRRSLRFASIRELLADMDRIVASEKAGTLRRTGNWTAGQTFGHVATWITFAWNGFPFRLPWRYRLVLRWKKKSLLQRGFHPGERLPGAAGGTYGTERFELEDGAARLRDALKRLESGEPSLFADPAFGWLTRDEEIGMALRHAELHLSFLHP